MFLHTILAVAALAATSINASPIQELNARNLDPAQCSKVVAIVEVLKIQKATPFCSSFLSIKPATATSTVQVTGTVTTTSTATITSGTASTSIVFKPGNPPSKVRREANLAEPFLEDRNAVPVALEQRDPIPTLPAYLSAFPTSAISSACSCLSIPPRTTSVTATGKATATQTVTTSTTVTPPVVTSTKYRKQRILVISPSARKTTSPANIPLPPKKACATPVPSLIPTLPFGKSNDAGVGDLSNSLYGQGTSGTTLEGCCNLCYFGLPNCVQAIYYSYQGCVVRQPAAPTGGTGVGVSDVCPNGQFQGLTYTPDLAPPFRSQGLLAGPCGQVYNNL
ncbi:MAG: hypothetical protein LQ344_006680 [Seirophora lacunosa]|nr:MAG: hypothetical protein LQ344_006680 [Seirophora lacunosa]